MACYSVPTGTRFIFEAGVKLSFCGESIATACVYYHKFYQVMNKQDYNEHLVIMAALNLAAKTKERSVKLSDVVNTCHRCLHPGEAALEVSDVYWQLKESVAKYELLLLRALRFDIYITLPHSHLLHYMLTLSRWVDTQSWTKSRLPVISLSLLQDSYHTTLPLSHPPHKMATAVLYLAILCCRLVIPGNSRSVRKWWEVFCPDTTETALQHIARQIMTIYDDDNITDVDSGKMNKNKTTIADSSEIEKKTATIMTEESIPGDNVAKPASSNEDKMRRGPRGMQETARVSKTDGIQQDVDIDHKEDSKIKKAVEGRRQKT